MKSDIPRPLVQVRKDEMNSDGGADGGGGRFNWSRERPCASKAFRKAPSPVGDCSKLS